MEEGSVELALKAVAHDHIWKLKYLSIDAVIACSFLLCKAMESYNFQYILLVYSMDFFVFLTGKSQSTF